MDIESKMSAQTIYQKLVAVRNYQYGLSLGYNDSRAREELERLQERLRPQIEAWGGINAIDSWLVEHDLGHDTPSQIEQMDWSWLSMTG